VNTDTSGHLTLDDDTHIYRLDGRIIPGVTEILKDVGLCDHFDDGNSEWYMERGRAVHAAIQYCIDGSLDWDTVEPCVMGFMHAFTKARVDLRFEVLACEKMVFDETRWYAGTLDLLVKMEDGYTQLWDIKSGSPLPWHGLQTAAYAAAKFKTMTQSYKRYGLYLREDGTYRLVPHDGLNDFNDFFSAVNIYHAKRRR
jgi:hypothetical protein